MRLLILDNEAIGALRDPHHPHHRRAMAYLEAHRPSRRADQDRRTVVPTAVRVEAGWDRTAPDAAFVNRLAIVDVRLDDTTTDRAASLASRPGISVADAHVGAVIHQAEAGRISILTSDPDDMRTVAADRPVTILTL